MCLSLYAPREMERLFRILRTQVRKILVLKWPFTPQTIQNHLPEERHNPLSFPSFPQFLYPDPEIKRPRLQRVDLHCVLAALFLFFVKASLDKIVITPS